MTPKEKTVEASPSIKPIYSQGRLTAPLEQSLVARIKIILKPISVSQFSYIQVYIFHKKKTSHFTVGLLSTAYKNITFTQEIHSID